MRLRRSEATGTVADAPRDAGFSLIEVLVTIVLIGTVLLPIMAASATAVRSSSQTREAAETETVLQNAADRLNRAAPSCDYTQFVEAAVKAKGWDPALITWTSEHYEPGPNVATAGNWQPGACGSSGRTALLIQRVTVTLKSPKGVVTQQIQVIKNDV